MAKLFDNYAEGRLQFTLKPVAGAGGMLAVQNDGDTPLLIDTASVNITGAVAGQTFDAGTAATAISADNLMDGQSLATPGRLNNKLNPGANGKSCAYWPVGHWLTFTPSGTPTGLAGKVDIHAVPVN